MNCLQVSSIHVGELAQPMTSLYDHICTADPGSGGREEVKFAERDVEVTDETGIHFDFGAFLTNVTVKGWIHQSNVSDLNRDLGPI